MLLLKTNCLQLKETGVIVVKTGLSVLYYETPCNMSIMTN